MRELRKRRQNKTNKHTKTRHTGVLAESNGSTTGLSSGGSESGLIDDSVIFPKLRSRKRTNLKGSITSAISDDSSSVSKLATSRRSKRQSDSKKASGTSESSLIRNPDEMLTGDNGTQVQKDDGSSSDVENLNTSYHSRRRVASSKIKNDSLKESARITKKSSETHVDKSDNNTKTAATARPVRGKTYGPTLFTNVTSESETLRQSNVTSGRMKNKPKGKVSRRVIKINEGDDSVFESHGERTIKKCSVVLSRIRERDLSPVKISGNNTDLIEQEVDFSDTGDNASEKLNSQAQKKKNQEELLSLEEEIENKKISDSGPTASTNIKSPSLSRKKLNQEELLSLVEDEFGIDSFYEPYSEPTPATSKSYKVSGKHSVISPRLPETNLSQGSKSDSYICLEDCGVDSPGSGKDKKVKRQNLVQKSRNQEELLSILEEEFGIDNFSGSDPEPAPSISKEQQSVLKKTESKGNGAGKKSLAINSFYSSKIVTEKPSHHLKSWLRSKNTDSDGPVISSDAMMLEPVADSDRISTGIKFSNVRTPMEIRSVSKLVESSTPHPASCEADCKEDLFGFENLLNPVARFLEDMSPIPNPKLPKRKKPTKAKEQKTDNKPMDSLLNITNLHLLGKPKEKTQRNTKTKHDMSDVQLFEVEPLKEPKNNEDVYEFEDDVESPVKPKRSRRKPTHNVDFHDVENALPWAEIMSHELVIESA